MTIKVKMDETQFVFLFKNGKMVESLNLTGRILKYHKQDWITKGADKVISLAALQPGKL